MPLPLHTLPMPDRTPPTISLTRRTTLPHPLPTARAALLSPATVPTLTLLPAIAHSYTPGGTTRTHIVPAPAARRTPITVPTAPGESGDATTVAFTFAETVLAGWVRPVLDASWTFPDRPGEDGTWVGMYQAEVRGRGVSVRKRRELRKGRCGETGREVTEVTEWVGVWCGVGARTVARWYAAEGLRETVEGMKGVVERFVEEERGGVA